MPLQCKDIPTIPILQHLAIHGGIGCTWIFGDERDIRHAMPNGFELPAKLVLAKMKNLIAKDIIDGCGCGCRGDFELLQKGWDKLSKTSEK